MMLGEIVALRVMSGRSVFGRRAEHEEVMVDPFGVPAVMDGEV